MGNRAEKSGAVADDAMVSEQPVRSAAFISSVRLCPRSVLGTRLSAKGAFIRAPEGGLPDAQTVIVDPAGLHHIQPPGGPAGAGGAAGAIYKHLGIGRDKAFPAPVVEKVRSTGDAAFHTYPGSKHCIHVVGPDLRKQAYTLREGAEALSKAYRNVLLAYAAGGVPVLRLLPVSGGIYSGKLGNTPAKMATLTALALAAGFERLSVEERQALTAMQGGQISMCIFLESEMEAFQAVWERAVADARPCRGDEQ